MTGVSVDVGILALSKFILKQTYCVVKFSVTFKLRNKSIRGLCNRCFYWLEKLRNVTVGGTHDDITRIY